MAAIECTLERLTPRTGWSAASSLILKSFCYRTLRSLTAAISIELLARREKIDETLHGSKCERSMFRCAVHVGAGLLLFPAVRNTLDATPFAAETLVERWRRRLPEIHSATP